MALPNSTDTYRTKVTVGTSATSCRARKRGQSNRPAINHPTGRNSGSGTEGQSDRPSTGTTVNAVSAAIHVAAVITGRRMPGILRDAVQTAPGTGDEAAGTTIGGAAGTLPALW